MAKYQPLFSFFFYSFDSLNSRRSMINGGKSQTSHKSLVSYKTDGFWMVRVTLQLHYHRSTVPSILMSRLKTAAECSRTMLKVQPCWIMMYWEALRAVSNDEPANNDVIRNVLVECLTSMTGKVRW